jgi:hypothetical protein
LVETILRILAARSFVELDCDVKEPRLDSPTEMLSTEKEAGFLFRIQKWMKSFKFGKCYPYGKTYAQMIHEQD